MNAYVCMLVAYVYMYIQTYRLCLPTYKYGYMHTDSAYLNTYMHTYTGVCVRGVYMYICTCESKNMDTKYKIFMTVTYPFIGMSIVYRYTDVYNFKVIEINEKNISLSNKEHLSAYRCERIEMAASCKIVCGCHLPFPMYLPKQM